MKRLLIVPIALMLMASTPTVQQLPPNCHFSCEGWLFGYPGKREDHLDDLNYFVKNTEAKTQTDAQVIADQKAQKVGLK